MSEVSKEVKDYVENLEQQLSTERTRRTAVENQLTQSSFTALGKEQNVIELQLELDETLNQLYHQLSGHEVQFNPETNKPEYVEPKDDRLKNFSEYGVKLIMNKLKMYLNINTLMAFYDEDTIKWKVKDFGEELTDLFLTRYEAILFYPTPEELFEKYKPIIEEANAVKPEHLRISDEELYKRCILWSEDELQAKENLLSGICWDLINMVHSVYTRAFLGKERTSLGERGININQSQNPNDLMALPMNKGGFLSKLKG